VASIKNSTVPRSLNRFQQLNLVKLSGLSKTIIIFPVRIGLQREHFTPLLRPNDTTLADQTATYLLQRIFITLFQV
jgi:hypothetical protein